jgi:hypothetical protein
MELAVLDWITGRAAGGHRDGPETRLVVRASAEQPDLDGQGAERFLVRWTDGTDGGEL